MPLPAELGRPVRIDLQNGSVNATPYFPRYLSFRSSCILHALGVDEQTRVLTLDITLVTFMKFQAADVCCAVHN